MKEKSIILFNQKTIRRHWDKEEELWYFSVIDVVEVLTDSAKPRDYWYEMKKRVKDSDGIQLSTFCRQLKLTSADDKKYLTDCATTESLLRIIQSIPSPKAEPFKVWLAKVGYERIEETEDPELSFDRAMKTYLNKGYSRDWINQRLKSIEVRKELTDEWHERGMKEGSEFAILTNEITKAWTGKTVKELKEYKGLKKQNLRDNMTNLELVLNMLAEASTKEISEVKKPVGLVKNKIVANEGGHVAKKARDEIELRTGKDVVTKRLK
jgi:hypothetical protein